MTDNHFLAALGDATEPLSRAEIAERSGLSKPAISAAAVRLLERGVIRQVGIREGRRGGVATLLAIDSSYGHSLGVAVRPESVLVRSMDVAGGLIGTWQRELGEGAAAEELVRATNDLIAAADPGTPLLAAGISLAHAVDSAAGKPVVVSRSASQRVVFDPVVDLHLGQAGWVRVDNDVNWATLAEHQQGSLGDCHDFVYVYCGAGLGAGLYLDGRLYRGARGLAGEIGYLRDSTDRTKDITERLAALGLGASNRYGLDVAAAETLFAARPLSNLADEILDAVAIGLENIAVTLDPEAFAIGGPLASCSAFFEGIAARVAEFTTHSPRTVPSTSTPLDGASLTAHAHALELAGIPVSRSQS